MFAEKNHVPLENGKKPMAAFNDVWNGKDSHDGWGDPWISTKLPVAFHQAADGVQWGASSPPTNIWNSCNSRKMCNRFKDVCKYFHIYVCSHILYIKYIIYALQYVLIFIYIYTFSWMYKIDIYIYIYIYTLCIYILIIDSNMYIYNMIYLYFRYINAPYIFTYMNQLLAQLQRHLKVLLLTNSQVRVGRDGI